MIDGGIRVEGRVRGAVRASLGWIAYWLGMHRRLFADRAVIVLFHRVDDALGHNPISCTSRMFGAYCRFFARHFTVIGLTELVARLERGESLRGRLVITFDDGYEDNRLVAASTLRRHDLPACFFVATGYIGTRETGPWDAANGVVSRWMSWDQVRELRADGFEVGSHTVSHVDLGAVSPLEAAHELSASRTRLEMELGDEIAHFAYPFGRRANITEGNRDEVRGAGFRTCSSAYGGFVERRSSPFSLPRFPVSGWYRSPYSFGFDLLRDARNSGGVSSPGDQPVPGPAVAVATVTPRAARATGAGSSRRSGWGRVSKLWCAARFSATVMARLIQKKG